MSSSKKDEFGIKRILVAVDGSENATRAVKVASTLAKDNNAKLTILHVITIPAVVYSGDVAFPLNKIEVEARRQGEKYVESAQSTARQAGVKAETEIIESIDSPVRGITDYSEKNMIDLIVVGTRGLGGFKRLLLGSVGSGVVHYAHCSVLVVR
ncbi:MAG TPA: universal stress protein [Nitrososphaerales archaeon]|nr:universal stress protein [Nitrososphaerales archaeon]